MYIHINIYIYIYIYIQQHTATYCNIHKLLYTAASGNTLQHMATHCNTRKRTARQCNILQHAPYCHTLQYTATHTHPR